MTLPISRIVFNGGLGFLTGTPISQEEMDNELNQLVGAVNELHQNKFEKGGGVLTGPVQLAGDATQNLHPVTKQQWDAQNNSFSNSLSQETTDRQNADAALQAELDTTQSGAGLNTGGTYSANGSANYINGASTLKNADDLLDSQVKTNADGLAQEITDRTNADNTLQNNLNNAQTTLQNNIDNEATARQNADNTLTNNLNTHTSNTSNPHSVTAAQVGLSNLTNDLQIRKNVDDSTNGNINLVSATAPSGSQAARFNQIPTNLNQLAVRNFGDLQSIPNSLAGHNITNAAVGNNTNNISQFNNDAGYINASQSGLLFNTFERRSTGSSFANIDSSIPNSILNNIQLDITLYAHIEFSNFSGTIAVVRLFKAPGTNNWGSVGAANFGIDNTSLVGYGSAECGPPGFDFNNRLSFQINVGQTFTVSFWQFEIGTVHFRCEAFSSGPNVANVVHLAGMGNYK